MPTSKLASILARRLVAHHLSGDPRTRSPKNEGRTRTPSELVRWFGAVQAQDYVGARWAIAQRAAGASSDAFDRAFEAGEILRTHVLRPTWHLVSAADVRWMLAVTSPRVHAANTYQAKRLGLDARALRRAGDVLDRALAGGSHMTRVEVAKVLGRERLDVSTAMHVTCLLFQAELDGVVCSGAMRGKHHTYARLEERVPPSPEIARGEALAELARRYFQSHGPATVRDYAWWSGLTLADARAGIASAGQMLVAEEIEGNVYWAARSDRTETSGPRAPRSSVRLLPNYDEYVVAYADRDAFLEGVRAEKLDARGNVLFNHCVIAGGQVVGVWRRAIDRDEVSIDVTSFRALTTAERRGLATAAESYAASLGLRARLVTAS